MIRRIKNIGHLLFAIAANCWYGFPSRKLVVIGITGTDGKTTTSSIIYHVLKTAGYQTAMITTVGAYIGDQVYDVGFHVTTPSAFAIQRYLRKAVNQGNTHVILEITSHALDQQRAWGINFLYAILTNISHEHLDYHKTYKHYVLAKTKLLLQAKTVILNRDDQSFQLVKPLLSGHTILSYSVMNQVGSIGWKSLNLDTQLLGDFNKSNLLAAFVVCHELTVDKSTFEKVLNTYQLPKGRQEIIHQKPLVMIDFAHTPNALAQILPVVKQTTKGKLIHIFGSAGLRDQSKRPEMGKESSKYADIIILTSEDPRTESANDICLQIQSGLTADWQEVPESYRPKIIDKKIYYRILDREKAIHLAITIAQQIDTILITGKGHETSMNYGDGEVPWNEREIIEKYLTRYH